MTTQGQWINFHSDRKLSIIYSMHPRFLLNYQNVFGTESGGFITSCLTVQRTNEFEVLEQLLECFAKDPFYTMSDPNTNYSLSVFWHESRHFHDFIESPFSLPLILSAGEKWSITSLILNVSNMKNVEIAQPAFEHIDEIASLIGEDLTIPLINSYMIDSYFLNFVGARKQLASESRYDFIVTIGHDRLPPLPALVTEGLVIPINLRELMEGSAVLSQLNWILSSLGTKIAKEVWSLIQRAARRNNQFEYVVCLWALQKLFGENSIFEMGQIRALRKIFRFSMYGALPLTPSIIDFRFSDKELLDLPYNRFAAILNTIKEWKLQADFFLNPDKIIGDIADQIWPDWQENLEKFKKKLADVANRPNVLRTDYMGDLEFAIMEQILNLYKLGVWSDHKEVDHYFEKLWAYDNPPQFIKPPIQVFRLPKEKPPVMEISDECGDRETWLRLYILDALNYQFLYAEKIFCPLSFVGTDCDLASREKVLLSACNGQECIVANVARHIGLLAD